MREILPGRSRQPDDRRGVPQLSTRLLHRHVARAGACEAREAAMSVLETAAKFRPGARPLAQGEAARRKPGSVRAGELVRWRDAPTEPFDVPLWADAKVHGDHENAIARRRWRSPRGLRAARRGGKAGTPAGGAEESDPPHGGCDAASSAWRDAQVRTLLADRLQGRVAAPVVVQSSTSVPSLYFRAWSSDGTRSANHVGTGPG